MKGSTAAQAGEVPCPDPSVHDHHNKLSEQASTAALYATHPERNTQAKDDPLGPDGKLSARSAAASLKYARPQDLPSFPTVGIDNTSNSAGKAAMLAKDYKMKDLWQPELSSAGSKAALIAARDGGKLDLWEPSASKEGNSAATIAMRTKGLSPQIDYGYTADGKSRALQAATLSVNRGRSGSTPTPVAHPAYPDSKNSAHNALNAATVSHRAGSVKAAPDGWDSEANQAARIKNLSKSIDPRMFGEHPPIHTFDEEEKHDAALHASAISMAKQMYEYQNRTVLGADLTGGLEGASAAAARQAPSSQKDVKQEALRYIHLQDAAHKLAQERLAKIDKTTEDARYREYYGYPDNKVEPSTTPRKPMRRLSIRGRTQPRESVDPDDFDDDEEQARRIRNQMSQLGNNLNDVDEKKRTDDRAKLMAAAEKRVHDRMHVMDEKVFNDTGKVTPAMMQEWEAQARKRMQDEKEMQAQHPGKTHIGGGKFIDNAEIEAIAAARLKPTLDEINATAERKRARDEEIRIQREDIERGKREEKQKKAEEKDEQKRIKNEEKVAVRKEKDEAKARKEEEKRAAEEQKRLAREEQRKSREAKRVEATEIGGAAAGGVAAEELANEERVHQEPGVTAETGETGEKATEKRSGGTLGRWASKLRKNRKPEEEKEVGKTIAPERQTGGVSGTVVGGAAGVAGAAAIADETHDAHVDDEDHDDLDDDEDEEPMQGPTVVAPAVNVVPAEHVADVSPLAGATLRPDLERHISTLQISDDEDGDEDDDENDDDDDELYEDEYRTLGGSRAHETAARVLSAPQTEFVDAEEKPVQTADRAVVDEPEGNDHHYGRDAAVAGGAGAAGVAAYDATNDKQGTDTGPAPRTVGPHESDVANVIDPRIQPDPQSLKESAKPEDKRGQPTARATAADVTALTSKPESGLDGEEQHIGPGVADENITHPERDDMNKGGIVGLYNRLRGAHKRKEQRVPTPAEYKARASQDASRTSAGPNSSKADESAADVASSGLDDEEEAMPRGREATRPDVKTTAVGKEPDAEEDQFEEARDHFDESLAPPPAFAGQAKNESPVRGTRFREEV